MSKINQIECCCLNCSKIFSVSAGQIAPGRGKYCSHRCRGADKMRKHGHTTHSGTSPTYNSWTNMVARCHRPSAGRYKDYGAKGITVCDRWRFSFENFLADMGERPEGCTLDRKDNKEGYTPENCKWSTAAEQQRNRKNNVNITIDGITLCLEDWASKSGINKNTLAYRLKAGWPTEKLLSPTTRTLLKSLPNNVAAQADNS